MPPDVYGALVQFVRDRLGADCWLNREPEQTDATSRKLPYIVLQGTFDTDWTFEPSFVDRGEVTFYCFAVGDDDARGLGEQLKALFAPIEIWGQIPIQDAQFVNVLRTGYGLFTEEEPNKDGNVVYRYEVRFDVKVSGAY